MKGRKKRRISKERRTKPIYIFKAPEWFLALEYRSSDHGSNAHQKRLWRLVSEYVRQRDFKLYGRCAVCSVPFPSWMGGQAGHFKAWSVCKGMFKYNDMNLAMICGGCNSFGDDSTGYKFGVELNRRHGAGHTDWILQENLRHEGEKMELPLLVAYAEEILTKKKAL
jgi:hypothetical protein